ncbi:tachylectin-related carbohydrate-binding protein [Lentzea sp. NPDC051838]|uniref:tachylectin-related carbohydrate-binding protein n=1 Tax=Lentzea sp. NPDC051838 TaxID=3154849 RepID=UPI00341B7B2A
MIVTPSANAASSLVCNTAANVIGVTPSGSLFTYPHEEPENGNFVWGAKQSVPSSGWQTGRTLAGPSGVIYSLHGATGELRRFRLNGSQWVTQPGGGEYRVVGSGWGRYSQAEHRNKVTIDEKGRLFEINPDGLLKMFVWEGGDDGWWSAESGGGKILDTGWNQYNLIVAAGDGVLYARKPDGTLFRFRYDAAADQFIQYGKHVGNGWQMFNRVFSPGGDTLYGTWPGQNGQGQLLWYRYLEDTNTWAPGDPNTGLGKVVGTGWYGELDVVADTNSCRLTGYPATPRPVVRANFTAPVTLVEGSDKLANYFFVNDRGTLYHGHQRRSDDLLLVDHTPLTGYEKFTGTPAAGLQVSNKLEVQAHSYDDADARGKTQTSVNGTWGAGLAAHRGHLAGDSVLVKGSDGLLSSFGVAGGKLWYRKQIAADGVFPAWRSLGGADLTSDFTVVRNGDSFEVVARHTDGSVRAARLTNGVLGEWKNLGGTDAAGKPAVVLHPGDGTLQVLVRKADNKVYTQKQNSAGWPGAWTIIDGLTAAGAPAAVMTQRGTIEAVVRGTDNLVYTTGQNQQYGSFRTWTVRDTHEAATDVSTTAWSDGSWLITWRDPLGELYTYLGTYGSVSARSADTPVYRGGRTQS